MYNKSMEKQIAINLSSEQYQILLEMFSFVSSMDLYDADESPEDFEKFDNLWDSVLNTKEVV